ncbi:hypothetical protein M3Y97_00182000 [Aphelenchoides bicaudatus]|nr:hypothetical protein M3Y97_00182000 [Aphelenchoides bicaudatus]
MGKLSVFLLAVLAAVCFAAEPKDWTEDVSRGILPCSNQRSRAYLDVFVVYDRTLRANKFTDLTTELALIGFDSKVTVDLDISRVVNTEQLDQAISSLPSKRTEPTDKTALTDALVKTLKMVKTSGSTRDRVVILAVSARSIDSDSAAHGWAMQLQSKGAHVLTLNFDDQNLLLDSYLRLLADKGKAFTVYNEPHFDESFSRAIDYANCRCLSAELEEGQPIQQLSIYNYTSNHVDYFANCLAAAIEQNGATIREWCAALGAKTLPTPTNAQQFLSGKLSERDNTLVDFYHFVESFVILNNYELNTYNAWLVGEARIPTLSAKSRNSKHRAFLSAKNSLVLSRSSTWDYINLGQTNNIDDLPYICQKRACDALNPCTGERKSTNFYDLANLN